MNSYEPSDDALEQNPAAGIQDKGHKPSLGAPRGIDLSRIRKEAAATRGEPTMGDFDPEDDVVTLKRRWREGPRKARAAAASVVDGPVPAPEERKAEEVWMRMACAALTGGAADMDEVIKSADVLLEAYTRRFGVS